MIDLRGIRIRILNRADEGFIALLLVVMTLLVFIEVILRFGFDTGLQWSEELTLYMSAWLVLFGASYGVKIGSHIGVDAFVNLLPSKGRRVAGLVSVALCLVYCVLFLMGSWQYLDVLVLADIEMEDLPIPRWIAQSILFVGFVMLAMRFIEAGWRIIKGEADGLPHFAHVDKAHSAKEPETHPSSGDAA
ncbi:MAG: TRAP transporter small permease [Burkholderiales bacterium]